MRSNRADARRSLDANFDRTAFRESDVTLRSAVTVTVQAEAVGLRTNRLSHHRMMSGNVWDGCKLVRRSYYGRLHGFAHSRALARKGRNVTENRFTYTRYWLPERVLRTILISSTAVVVVVIENRARKAFSEPGRPCTPPVSG